MTTNHPLRVMAKQDMLHQRKRHLKQDRSRSAIPTARCHADLPKRCKPLREAAPISRRGSILGKSRADLATCALPRRSISVGKCVGRIQRNADNACAAVTSCIYWRTSSRNAVTMIEFTWLDQPTLPPVFCIPVDNLPERPLQLLNNASGS